MRHAEVPLLSLLLMLPGTLSASGADLLAPRSGLGQAHFLGLDTAELLEPSQGLASMQTDVSAYTLTPEGTEAALIPWRIGSAFHARLGILPWLETGVELPLVLAQDALSPDQTTAVGGGIGDLQLDLRSQLPISSQDFQLLAATRLSLPTGNPETWTGEDGPTLHPRLIMGGTLPSLRWTSSLGVHLRGNTSVLRTADTTWKTLGSELSWGVGVEAALHSRLSAGIEAEGRVGSQAGSFDDPTELRAGISWNLKKMGQLRVGMAMGVGTSYATAAWRTFAGLSIPILPTTMRALDPDGDGVFSRADACPDEPEDRDGFQDWDGCAEKDNDQDGIADHGDTCPMEPETLNEFQDGDGCPDQVTDSDGDTVADHLDRCVNEPEDRDAFEDSDGCPEPDNDHDGLLDNIDQCPDSAERFNGLDDEDGCPDETMVFTSSAGGGLSAGASLWSRALPARHDAPAWHTSQEGGAPAGDSGTLVAMRQADALTEKGATSASSAGMSPGSSATPAPSAAAVDGAKAPLPPAENSVAASVMGTVQGTETLSSAPQRAPQVQPVAVAKSAPAAKSGPSAQQAPAPAATEEPAPGTGGFLDSDGDGIVDPRDKCPFEAELRNGVLDNDGCPELDSDQDGLVDPVDKCPKRAETPNGYEDDDGCPEVDSDSDGIADGIDTCPKVPETVNGLKDMDGCPEIDTDGDGFYDIVDKCPARPETVNGLRDDDGCPEPDTDKDGFPDEADKCPNQVETANGIQDDDGCPDGDQLPEDRTARAQSSAKE